MKKAPNVSSSFAVCPLLMAMARAAAEVTRPSLRHGLRVPIGFTPESFYAAGKRMALCVAEAL